MKILVILLIRATKVQKYFQTAIFFINIIYYFIKNETFIYQYTG
jgi:hypothetical protein